MEQADRSQKGRGQGDWKTLAKEHIYIYTYMHSPQTQTTMW